MGPPTLTKEGNPPMPNLGPPIKPPPLSTSSTTRTTTATSAPVSAPPKVQQDSSATAAHPAATTPKAVVKPQVLTHIIDGHIIKESSQPFPITPATKSEYSFIIVVYPPAGIFYQSLVYGELIFYHL